ncbi:MAG: exonuclease SbcCD subunit D [Actinomycetota bacterium]|nr:exonuclease SbcCD subunit D [Actinomycetota bacterium]
MRVVHISDTHLGYTAYRSLDPELGINQREADIFAVFKQAIDKILEISPDVVLHTGDLFDSVRPSNRSLSLALEQLLRLSTVGIPVVIIAGNHSMPRMRDTGSVFQLFTLFPNFFPVYKGRYETISIKASPRHRRGSSPPIHRGDLTIHAIPQCLTKADFEANLAQLNRALSTLSAQGYNVLMLHAAIAGVKEFSMGEFNEQEVPTAYLKPELDYIALGHYHKCTQVQENAYYVGSTERLTFNEVGQEKGFLEVDLSEKEVNFHPLEIRPMIDLPEINAQGMDADSAMQAIERVINPAVGGAIVRLTVNNISTPTYNALDFARLGTLTVPALHFEIRYNKDGEEQITPMDIGAKSIGNLPDEFREFMSKTIVEKDKEKLLELGLKYLRKAGEEE